ncbi:OmpA family protein [Daejeonella lutea]|uniref:OmpA-OmpF porin, OOP family n=1 Tax=Daejeonella lutea TaxID=572036 RepID=A0A1T5DDX8_9SPHI|nr:OmpA family protein [Daejeonella lutea]SKB69919.1 OmpA-OmpF porin, OOP family [Daejeonella lutea]
MNYSTIKKAVAFSVVAVLGLAGVAEAQDATSSSASSSAKVFGGRGQYRTWSLGINAGVLAPQVFTGGTNDFNKSNLELGYGLSLRKQLGHAFGLQLDAMRGELSGENVTEKAGIPKFVPAGAPTSFETDIAYAVSLSGVANVATVDFLRRENNLNFYAKGGWGIAGYALRSPIDLKGRYGDGSSEKYVQESFFPVGVGAKFKVSERVNFDLGYTQNFLDGDNIDQYYGRPSSQDKWSYGYAGLEFSLGSTAKPNLDWVNPVALMYDELKDPTLRQEVEALKGRVAALEAQDLLKDSDGDGVADKLDKCPGTEAGVKVDGSGCPLDVDADGIPDSKDACPTVKGTAEYNGCPAPMTATATGNVIQFEFDSSVLRTDAFPILDRISSDLRSNSSARVQLDGHASSEGTNEYNMTLSRDRANSVKTYLVNSGVAASRISTSAFGESRPVASNATESGRIANRRVEAKMQ